MERRVLGAVASLLAGVGLLFSQPDWGSIVHLVLLHGTFAPGAKWTRFGAPFQKRLLEKLGPDTTIESVAWSGRNSRRAREIGVSRLAAAVERSKSRDASAGPTILVGHSHGGTIIANYLRRYPASGIAAAVFLSTPFYALRPHWRSIGLIPYLEASILLIVFPMIVLFAIEPWFMTTLVPRAVWNTGRSPSLLSAGIALFFDFLPTIATFLLGLWIVWRGSKRTTSQGLQGVVVRALAEERSTLESCDLSRGSYLFVRVSGDEVASLFGFALALQTIVRLAWWVLSLGVWPIARFMRIRTGRVWVDRVIASIGYALGFCAFAMVTVVAFIIAHDPELEGLTPLQIAEAILMMPTFAAQVVLNSGYGASVEIVFLSVASGVMVELLVLLAAMPIVALLGSLVAAAMSGLSWSMTLFGQLATEPIPYGSRELIHVPWDKSQPPSLLQIAPSHGLSYEDATTADKIADWLQATVAARDVGPQALVRPLESRPAG